MLKSIANCYVIFSLAFFFSCTTTEVIEPCSESVWFLDADGDGRGNPNVPVLSCEQPNFFVANKDDDNDDPNPIVMEVEEDCSNTWFFDSDGDGYGGNDIVVIACEKPDYFVDNYDDWDDTDENLNPDSIWSGEKITFTKEGGVNWLLEANYDQITENVWLTRGDRQGLFNVKYETSFSFDSPERTLWARGTTDDLPDLSFNYFRSTLSFDIGDEILNTDLVLYIPEEGVFIDIKFTSWESGRDGGEGGFSYERSTPHK